MTPGTHRRSRAWRPRPAGGRWPALLLLGLALGGCKRSAPSGSAPATAGADGAATPSAAPAGPTFAIKAPGSEDPFARLDGEAVRHLNAGYKALRSKDWKSARQEFDAVVARTPDYGAARFQLLRAAALDGDFDEAVRQYGELLARELPACVGRLDKARDLAPLRASPAWARVASMEETARAAYGRDLRRGIFFVARGREPGTPITDGKTRFKLEQEAWFFDPLTSRYRRLTETGGRVYAIAVAPDRHALAFLLVDRMRAGEGAEVFLVGAQVGLVDLSTLRTEGPFALDPEVALVQLSFTAAGEARWRTEAADFLVDSTRTALVRGERGADDRPPGGITVAGLSTVAHFDDGEAAVALSADGRALTVAGSEVPIRSARPIDAASLAWSPGRRRLAYAGVLDACKAMAAPKSDRSAANELFVWDVDKRIAVRVAQAISTFESTWLDDDRLAYEGGVGREGRLHLYDLRTRDDVVLKPRLGAGLYGCPTLGCDKVFPVVDGKVDQDAVPEGD